MPKVNFLGNRIGVTKADKAQNQKKPQDSLFVKEPEVSENLGEIQFVGEEVKNPHLQVGTRVYFGSKRELIRMSGKDVYVMGAENVLATVEKDNEEATNSQNEKAS